MNIDHMTQKERDEFLAELADVYYNEQMTQAEIAKRYNTNRFRVAKLLTEAREEGVVEIKIRHSGERIRQMEAKLRQRFGLKEAIVVNSRFTTYADAIKLLGKIGAEYLGSILTDGLTVGLMWGKTIHSIISQLPAAVPLSIAAVQCTGFFKKSNPAVDVHELVRMTAAAFNGSFHFINAPLYVADKTVRAGLLREPQIAATLAVAKKMDILVSGFGGPACLPLSEPEMADYVTKRDRAAADTCVGSIYGRMVDKSGKFAATDLNDKVLSAPIKDILAVPHRLVAARGRHKTTGLAKAMRQGLFNELLTDADTAGYLLADKN